MKGKKPVLYETDEANFNVFAANTLKEKFETLQRTNQKIDIALSGGSTPLPIYNLLKEFELKWELINFFMVDERFVSINSEQSNYKNIYELFFKFIPSTNYSMVKEGIDIDTEVESYKAILNSKVRAIKNNMPSFDLVLLGMGEDGHTASLFPGTDALNNISELAAKNYVPKLDSYRISLTFPLIMNAKEAIVLIKGRKKKKILKELYSTEDSIYPIHKLVKSDLKLSWIVA